MYPAKLGIGDTLLYKIIKVVRSDGEHASHGGDTGIPVGGRCCQNGRKMGFSNIGKMISIYRTIGSKIESN